MEEAVEEAEAEEEQEEEEEQAEAEAEAEAEGGGSESQGGGGSPQFWMPTTPQLIIGWRPPCARGIGGAGGVSTGAGGSECLGGESAYRAQTRRPPRAPFRDRHLGRGGGGLGGAMGGGLAQGLGIYLFAFGGAYWPLATAHSEPLWARTCFGCVNGAPGWLVLFDYSMVGCPGDGLLPVPLTTCIPMHTPSPCWVCRLQQ